MTTRRQLLAAAVAAPIAATAPVVMAQQFVCAPSNELDIAIARFRKAWAAYQAHPIHRTRFDDPDYEQINADGTLSGNLADQALEVALRVPPRSGQDISTKLELVLAEYQDCELPENLIQIVADSARHLGAMEARS